MRDIDLYLHYLHPSFTYPLFQFLLHHFLSLPPTLACPQSSSRRPSLEKVIDVNGHSIIFEKKSGYCISMSFLCLERNVHIFYFFVKQEKL